MRPTSALTSGVREATSALDSMGVVKTPQAPTTVERVHRVTFVPKPVTSHSSAREAISAHQAASSLLPVLRELSAVESSSVRLLTVKNAMAVATARTGPS